VYIEPVIDVLPLNDLIKISLPSAVVNSEVYSQELALVVKPARFNKSNELVSPQSIVRLLGISHQDHGI